MKRYILNIVLIALTITVASSCSSGKYNTTRVKNLDFRQYKTYGWLPPVDSLSKNYFSNDIARENILSSANEEIEKLGLTYSKENPDVLFRYVSIVNNKGRMVYSNPYWGHFGWGPMWGMGMGMGWNQPMGVEKYRYSHLIIEAFDRKSNSVVWQARGSSEVRNPERAINKLPKVVEGIFKQYPVR